MGTKKGNLGCNFCFGNKHYQDQDFKAMKLLHKPMGIDQLSFHRLWFALGWLLVFLKMSLGEVTMLDLHNPCKPT